MNEDEWFAQLSGEVKCFDPFYLEAWTFEEKLYVEPGSGRMVAPPKVEMTTSGGEQVRIKTHTLLVLEVRGLSRTIYRDTSVCGISRTCMCGNLFVFVFVRP